MLHTIKARLRSRIEDAYSLFLRKGIFHSPLTTGELHCIIPIAAKIYKSMLLNCIQPDIEKIL